MHDLWRCIAPVVCFIEVRRTDILASGILVLDVFKQNATFSSFELSLLCAQKPQWVAW